MQHRAGGYSGRACVAGSCAQPPRGVQRKKRIGEQQADDAPGRDDREVAPLDPESAPGRDVGVEERLEEVADREGVGEVDDAVGQLVVGDEDAGEEVERQRAGR